jgi:hypothetical protein
MKILYYTNCRHYKNTILYELLTLQEYGLPDKFRRRSASRLSGSRCRSGINPSMMNNSEGKTLISKYISKIDDLIVKALTTG